MDSMGPEEEHQSTVTQPTRWHEAGMEKSHWLEKVARRESRRRTPQGLGNPLLSGASSIDQAIHTPG